MRDEEQKKRKIRKQMVGGGDLKGGGRRGVQALRLLFFFFCHAGQPARKKKSLRRGKKSGARFHGLALTSEPQPMRLPLTFFSAAHPLVFFFFLGLSASSGSGPRRPMGCCDEELKACDLV